MHATGPSYPRPPADFNTVDAPPTSKSQTHPNRSPTREDATSQESRVAKTIGLWDAAAFALHATVIVQRKGSIVVYGANFRSMKYARWRCHVVFFVAIVSQFIGPLWAADTRAQHAEPRESTR